MSARYGTLQRDAGIALRGLYIINPQVPAWELGRGQKGDGWVAIHCYEDVAVAVAVAVVGLAGMEELQGSQAGQPAWNASACRHSLLQGVLEHITVNNFPIGRNVDEALRTLQASLYGAWGVGVVAATPSRCPCAHRRPHHIRVPPLMRQHVTPPPPPPRPPNPHTGAGDPIRRGARRGLPCRLAARRQDDGG